jgi:CRP/FNR family nitrogen fixation transcriptional regulator
MIVRNSANSTSVKPVPRGLRALTGEAAFWHDHKYLRGAQVFWEGKPAEYIYQIRVGAVRTYKLLSDGRRQIAAFYLPGDIFGVETDDLHRFTAEAIIETTVWIAKRHSMFEGLDGADLANAKSAFELLRQNLQHVREQLLVLGRQTALERVTSFLSEMDRRLKEPIMIILPMTHRDIADYLGLSLETVSRSLSVLRDRGIVSVESQRREVVLKDRTKLAQVVAVS